MSQNEFVIKQGGVLIPVTKEVYLAYYRTERHARYLEEKDARHGLVSYNAIDTDKALGVDLIVDSASEPIEESIIHNMLLERLRASLSTLTESECELVDALFFSNGGDGMSERECADKLVLSKTAVHARKEKILEKLKNMLENS